MPLPLTDSCFSKIQIGFTFLVPAHPGSPGQRAVKRVCVCVYGQNNVAYALGISRPTREVILAVLELHRPTNVRGSRLAVATK